MAYTKINYKTVEPVAEAMHFLREPLDSDTVGVTVVDCGPGWTGKTHDHAEEDHEEVYLLIEGEGTVIVDGDDVPMQPGDAIRIAPDATRSIRAGETACTFVLVGAP